MSSLKQEKIFNIFTISLKGIKLIEASAGTGKTYILIAIYLRLLLGLNNEETYLQPLHVEEILVVTFTESAIEELRSRIRENIHNLRLACLQGYSTNILFKTIITKLNDINLAINQLLTAELQIDNAAIFTIHGFCQRIINYYSIEKKFFSPNKVLFHESLLLKKISQNFWRKYCYPLPINIVRILQPFWKGPEQLLIELIPYLHGKLPILKNKPKKYQSIKNVFTNNIFYIQEIKKEWCNTLINVNDLIDFYSIKNKQYTTKKILNFISKINNWAHDQNINFNIPKELEFFSYSQIKNNKTKLNYIYKNLFKKIDKFYENFISLREYIFSIALYYISHNFKKEKKNKSIIGFDDLIIILNKALLTSEVLSSFIRRRYPIALIDEFQDTDNLQYNIFKKIYYNQNNCGLFLIGDPKQAIYTFRGADIFTYMSASSEIDNIYTLDTNWRSSSGIINAINCLFQSLTNPFIFKKIKFNPVLAGKNNLRLFIEKEQPAISFWLYNNNICFNEYRKIMAYQCAITIYNWLILAKNGKAWLENNNIRKKLQASDIKILVRNRNEAILVKKELKTLAIPTIFISTKDSVFKTLEANELLWLLEAILNPEDKNKLFCTLASNLLGVNAATIENINSNKYILDSIKKNFLIYKLNWQKNGISYMLRQIMMQYKIAERLLKTNNGERNLTDILHLSELLQEASIKLTTPYILLRWYKLQIIHSNSLSEHNQRRLDNEKQFIQILTIHKSKGLEFPIVLLPFAADFRIQKKPCFHDRKNIEIFLDLSLKTKSLKLAEEERLSEDIRLLYVAMTRSIYHCSVGIAPLFYKNITNGTISNVHLSALGYLIQKGKSGDANYLQKQLEILRKKSNFYIDISYVTKKYKTKIIPLSKKSDFSNISLTTRHFSQNIKNNFELTNTLKLKTNKIIKKIFIQKHVLNQHTFPDKTSSNELLKIIFNNYYLSKNINLNKNKLKEILTKFNIDHVWIPILQKWITTLFNTKLNEENIFLSSLKENCIKTNFSFSLYINNTLNDYHIHGIFNDTIDLVFYFNNRFYLLEYKTNWLGETYTDYIPTLIENEIIKNNYQLEYKLYTLALHRYLRTKITNYNYTNNFGGIFYIFIRGIDPTNNKNGIYYYRPDITGINNLDKILTKK